MAKFVATITDEEYQVIRMANMRGKLAGIKFYRDTETGDITFIAP